MAGVATFVALGAIAPVGAASRARRPNDPFVEQQWALEQIQVFDAWKKATGRGATVAIVDSGIDLKHPDLRRNLAGVGKDFVDGGDPQDENGHGTHVAGIVAAVTDNGRGVAGVAPRARLLPVRVLDESNSGRDRDVIAGIRWAANKGADVINVSIGHPVPLYGRYYEALVDDYRRAIAYAWRRGAVIVLAAGNNYQPLCEGSAAPALCVGATGAFEEKSHYSNFDVTTLDNYLVAPGGETLVLRCEWQILSTWLEGRLREENGSCNTAGEGYALASGTSMAAPMVSGVAALLAGRGLTNDQIVKRILATADDLGAPGEDSVYGSGRVNAARAVRVVPSRP